MPGGSFRWAADVPRGRTDTMRLGIMQPYFAPALGYFDLINLSDGWIVFDTAQYRRRSWMSRNRILHPDDGWQYIMAPVDKRPRGTPISEITLTDGSDWRDRMLRQLDHYRPTAPHFEVARGLLAETLEEPTDRLAELSVAFLRNGCRLLDIPFQPEYFSRMELEMGPVEGPGDWALRISEALGADEYVNPPGGEDIFDPQSFREAGVRLRIRRFEPFRYDPVGYDYEPQLSLVDVLMWTPVDEVKACLEDRKRAFEEDR